ncbi:hypothetical protein QQX98_008398 [Neonectria punicea]|uniref:Uncharacterized protein n=1 Tax=Neonectria punicea TaxID=979145 RepID=A0ABR1GVA9_9HYPO
MALFRALAASLLISILASRGLAKNLTKTIVGCDEVQCPVEDGEPHCRVEDNIFNNIGLTRIPNVPDSLEDFSIVKGVNISGPNDDTYRNVYYLGTPHNVSLDEVYGCAVFFHDPPGRKFPENGTGACSDVIDQSCIDAIQDLAIEAVTYRYVDGICKVLQQELEEASLSACQNFTGQGTGIGSISAVSISNLTNINAKDNATSDCWPILPKSANLAPLYYDTRGWDGGPFPETGYNELHRITPLLTLFMKKSNQESVVSASLSRLSCLKINSTWTGGSEEWGNGTPRLAISVLTAVGAFAAFVMTL